MATSPTVLPLAGETLRFHVQSRTDLCNRYLVDLGEYGGNGRCTCRDFEIRKWPLIRDGSAPGERTRCWHIRRAREWMIDLVIARLSDDRKPDRKITVDRFAKT